MYTAEMTISPKTFVFIAMYNCIAFVHSRDAETAVIGSLTGFYNDAETSRLRMRVRIDLLTRMGSPVVVGENVEEYDFGIPEYRPLCVKDVGVSSVGRDRTDFFRMKDDLDYNQGLFRDAVDLPLAPHSNPMMEIFN